MPDKFGFDHLGATVRCIEPGCGAGGIKGSWTEAKREEHHHEHNTTRPRSGAGPSSSRGGNTMANTHRVTGREACIAALRAAGKPLTPNEIATAVVDSKVVKGLGVTGSTPKATLGAPIFRGAKEGRIYKRVGSGSPAKFALRADAPESDKALVAKLKPYVEKALNGAPAKKKPTAAKPSAAKATTAKKKPTARTSRPSTADKKKRKRSSARSAATA